MNTSRCHFESEVAAIREYHRQRLILCEDDSLTTIRAMMCSLDIGLKFPASQLPLVGYLALRHPQPFREQFCCCGTQKTPRRIVQLAGRSNL